jgi:serine/threonine protein kinase
LFAPACRQDVAVTDEGTPVAGEGAGAADEQQAASQSKAATKRLPASDGEAAEAAAETTKVASDEPAKQEARPAAKPRPKPPTGKSRQARPKQSADVSKLVSAALGGIGPGTEIAGYTVEQQIGEGGMAVVYRARDQRLSRQVALKLLAPGLAEDAAFRQRFIRESQAAAAVDHPNIIPVYEAGDAGGSLFIAMRFVQGGDVRTLLSDRGQLSAGRTWSIVSQVASALDAAHAAGLVHRDVKPANMLLDATARASGAGHQAVADEHPEHLYLSDFGIARLSVSTSHLTSTGQFVGTLDYIAPEQIDGRNIDGRADEYSLGCAAYELLAGSPPFRREQAFALIAAHLSEPPPTLTSRRPDLPPMVDRVLAAAMAKSPADRYPTCMDFADDLGRALGLLPGEAHPPGVVVPQQPAVAQARPATEFVMPSAIPANVAPGVTPPPQGFTGQPVPQQSMPGQQMPGMYQGQSGPQTPPAGYQGAPGYQSGPGQQVPAGYQFAPGQQGQAPGWGQPTSAQQWGQPGGGTWQGGPNMAGPIGPPMGPGQQMPGQYQPQQPQKPKRGKGVIAAISVAAVVVIAAAAVGAVALAKKNTPTTGPSSPPPTTTTVPASSPPISSTPAVPTAASEAAAINTVVLDSESSRSMIDTASSYVANCTSLYTGVSELRQVRNQRENELSQAEALNVSQLANGTVIQSDLETALQDSLSADTAYINWGRAQEEAGCSAAPPDVTSANNASTAAKTNFASVWNPVAMHDHYPLVYPNSF